MRFWGPGTHGDRSGSHLLFIHDAVGPGRNCNCNISSGSSYSVFTHIHMHTRRHNADPRARAVFFWFSGPTLGDCAWATRAPRDGRHAGPSARAVVCGFSRPAFGDCARATRVRRDGKHADARARAVFLVLQAGVWRLRVGRARPAGRWTRRRASARCCARREVSGRGETLGRAPTRNAACGGCSFLPSMGVDVKRTCRSQIRKVTSIPSPGSWLGLAAS